jgi:hypothetical protein|tara:strand:+ start:253 stop:651 length:399 start_codon:yes stop_codon:yes gene_type:complete
MATFSKKLSISLGSSVLFFLLNIPESYKLLGKLSGLKLIENNCRTSLGALVNTLVFYAISFLTMGNPIQKSLLKLKYSTYGSLIYFFVSSITLTQILFNTKCTTHMSSFIQSIIYCILLVLLMYLPTDGKLK